MSARLGDHPGELVHLSLRTAEGTELQRVLVAGLSPFVCRLGFPPLLAIATHPLLCQLARPLVLAVPQQLNNAALVRGEAGNLLDDLAHESGALAQVALGA